MCDGLGLTSLLHDYLQINTTTLVRALNDPYDLGIIARASLHHSLRRCGHLPFSTTRSLLSQHCMCMRQLSLLQSSPLRIKFERTILDLVGNDMWSKFQSSEQLRLIPPSVLYPIWDLGIYDLAHLLDDPTSPQLHIISTLDLRARFGPRVSTEHKLALNRLTRLFHYASVAHAMSHASTEPLDLAHRLVHATFNLIDLPHPHARVSMGETSVLPPTTTPRQHSARAAALLRRSDCYPPPSCRLRTSDGPLPGYRDAFAPHLVPSAAAASTQDPCPSLQSLQAQGVWGTHHAAVQRAVDRQLLSSHVSVLVGVVNPDVDISPRATFRLQLGLPGSSSPTSDDTAYVYRPDGSLLSHFSAARAHILSAAYFHALSPPP